MAMQSMATAFVVEWRLERGQAARQSNVTFHKISFEQYVPPPTWLIMALDMQVANLTAGPGMMITLAVLDPGPLINASQPAISSEKLVQLHMHCLKIIEDVIIRIVIPGGR
jgi:hypothetical protein